MKSKFIPYLVLFCGVLTVSTAALFIRYLQERNYSSLSIAAVRLSFAAMILTGPVLIKFQKELKSLNKRDSLIAIFAGFFLAIHFGTWISSMDYTSVTSSAALVSTTPIWAAVFSFLILKEKLSKSAALGIFITLTGSVIIFMSDKSTSNQAFTNPLLGNLLATLGAIGMCYYLILGRKLSAKINLWIYIWIVYSSAAFFLLMSVFMAKHSVLFLPYEFYVVCLILAVGPQLIGHTSYNWSLKYFSPVVISVAILGEPICTAILAGVFLNESIYFIQGIGLAILFAGILIALWGNRKTT